MKKIFILILAFTYLASASGATVYMHYCMGKMVEWNVVGNEKEKCPGCGMNKNKKDNKGCCKDEHKQLKVTNHHNIIETAFKGIQLFSSTLPVSYFEVPDVIFSSITEENPTCKPPPESSGIAIYKRNCVFRI